MTEKRKASEEQAKTEGELEEPAGTVSAAEGSQGQSESGGAEPQDEALAAEGQAGGAEEELTEREEGEELPDELAQVSAQAAEYLDGWQRARAELANYKKRVEKERRAAYVRAAGDILSQQLDVLDDLERALEGRPTEGEPGVWADGIELVRRKLLAVLDSHGVETINAVGQPFDPNFHEAISHEDTDEAKPGYVIDVVKQGYRMDDRVLRPALVRVAK